MKIKKIGILKKIKDKLQNLSPCLKTQNISELRDWHVAKVHAIGEISNEANYFILKKLCFNLPILGGNFQKRKKSKRSQYCNLT